MGARKRVEQLKQWYVNEVLTKEQWHEMSQTKGLNTDFRTWIEHIKRDLRNGR